MPLDPLVKAFLEQLPPGLKPWEQSDEDARVGFREFLKPFGPKDVPIGKVENRSLPDGLGLRLYRPVAAGGEALPALIFFHGGAFRVGDLDTHESVCRLIAGEAACRVIAVDYRLAPEHPFPAAYDDAYAALSWIEANAATLGIDPNRIAVGGDSSGGALAALVCQRAKAQGGPAIAYQLLLFPVTMLGGDFASLSANAEGYLLERSALEYCYERYAPKSLWGDPKLSPLLASDVAGLPPALVMLAEFDVLHDEGLAYAEKLRAAGVSVTVTDHPGQIHDFLLFQAVFPQAHEAIALVAKALQAQFEKL
jgi:acetyl esterase